MNPAHLPVAHAGKGKTRCSAFPRPGSKGAACARLMTQSQDRAGSLNYTFDIMGASDKLNVETGANREDGNRDFFPWVKL
jgi:hypothetical protein